MTGEERRIKILKKLEDAEAPLSGSSLAKLFHVSRQIIVQDIALIRAENHGIVSTNKDIFSAPKNRKIHSPCGFSVSDIPRSRFWMNF